MRWRRYLLVAANRTVALQNGRSSPPPNKLRPRRQILNHTVIIGLVVFAAIVGGLFAGMKLREVLPTDHLTEETINVVFVSTGVVATVSALVLGLLVSNANASFIRLGGQVTALSAQILRLDHILRRYGPDTEPARATLLRYASDKAADLFPDNPADVRLGNPSTYDASAIL